MAAITICSDFGAPQNKVWHCFPIYFPWSDGTKCHDHNQNNHDGVITHLEPDILECEVKWALESIIRMKLVKVMEFQLSYFKS